MRRVIFSLYLVGVLIIFSQVGWANDDTRIASRLFSDNLTSRDLPLGYREKPIQWRPEPVGFREKPIQWRAEPIGFRETPIPQLLEPRNGRENPPNFTERDSIVQSNLDPKLQMAHEDRLQFNNWPHLKIERTGTENSRITESLSERYQGYPDVNPPRQGQPCRLPEIINQAYKFISLAET